MEKREGVIKFTLLYQHHACLDARAVRELSGWRYILHQLELIGQDQNRYQGLGYGNISCRESVGSRSFIISGTQTGVHRLLSPEQYSLVTDCDPVGGVIRATGLAKPSSEAMTHGQLYQLDPSIMAVVHVHSPLIWGKRRVLGLASTPDDVPYGSLEMAEAVADIFARETVVKQSIFAMGGHEDGIVSFGENLREACEALVATLVEVVPAAP